MKLKLKSSQRLDAKNSQTSTPGEYYLKLSNSIVGRWDLKQVFICADFPNISAQNNSIPFFENGVDKTATLPPGYYSNLDITNGLETALNTASGGYNTYTCTLDFITQKITVVSNPNTFQFKFASFPGKSAKMLGFPIAIDTAAALTVTAPSIIVANSALAFNIKIDGCDSIIDSQGQPSTFDIPMNTDVSPVGGWMTYEPSESFRQHLTFAQPERILHIRVCDDSGVLLNLQQDWSMILEQC